MTLLYDKTLHPKKGPVFYFKQGVTPTEIKLPHCGTTPPNGGKPCVLTNAKITTGPAADQGRLEGRRADQLGSEDAPLTAEGGGRRDGPARPQAAVIGSGTRTTPRRASVSRAAFNASASGVTPHASPRAAIASSVTDSS